MKNTNTFEENPELKLAFDYVEYTNKNIFLTGKAGTGKTTFLHRLRSNSPKRMAIVAPTGVAAINAGGVTIHSFFQLPFGPHVPAHLQKGQQGAAQKRFNREKIQLIQSLDLLVIDEISMVRSDMLDAIDEVLRRYRDHHKPFGGVQLLMIGDLHQLPPVVKDDEWMLLRDYYDTFYFFGSRALQLTDPVSIELKHIYRQSDRYFISMLNQIRDNQVDYDLLNELNERYIPDFKPADDEGYITLTTHNASAQSINQTRLRELTTPTYMFSAEIKNDFPAYAYPTDVTLDLKVDAQVMFVKNDSSKDKRYYNGKIGRITRIEGKDVFVQCDGDVSEIQVGQEEWQNIRYRLNTAKHEIEEEVAGTFKQYPLKLAWAITIHKSQGLTFEKAIIDAGAAFAHGQVYVALSRCKSFEGLVLGSRIGAGSIRTDEAVVEYTRNIQRNLPDEFELKIAKMDFQRNLLTELFDATIIQKDLRYLNRIMEGNRSILHGNAEAEIMEMTSLYEKDIMAVSDKFRVQLQQLWEADEVPEMNEALQERVMKASAYFAHRLDVFFYERTKDLAVESDNKLVRESVFEELENLQCHLFVKIQCFKKMMHGFVASDYLHAKANAEVDFKPWFRNRAVAKTFAPKTMQHGELYISLKKWRDETAAERDVDPYMILAQKVLIEVVSKLPVTDTELAAIKGLGKKKISQFGSAIIDIIKDYCIDNKIEKTIQESVLDISPEVSVDQPSEHKKPKKEKTEPGASILKTIELYRLGNTIEEIARQREMAASTIGGHLADGILTGNVKIEEMVSEENVMMISKVFLAGPDKTLTEIKAILGDIFTFNELRAVKNHLLFEGKLAKTVTEPEYLKEPG